MDKDVFSWDPSQVFETVVTFTPVEVYDEEDTLLGTILMPTEEYASLSPEELKKEALKIYACYQTAKEILNPEAVEETAKHFKENIDVAEMIALFLWPQLVNIYVQLTGEGLPSDIRRGSKRKIKRFTDRIRPLLNTDEIYSALAESVWIEILSNALQEIQKEKGEEFLNTASDEELDKALEQTIPSLDIKNILLDAANIFFQNLARIVFESLDLKNKTIDDIKKFLGFQDFLNIPPDRGALYLMQTADLLPVPSNVEIQLGFRALWAGGKNWREKGFWHIDEHDGIAVAREKVGYNGSVLLWVSPKITFEEHVFTAKDMEAYIENLSPFTTDLAMLVLAALGNSEDPFNKPVKIHAEEIIKLKKMQARGEKKEEVLKRIDQEMKNLQRLHLSIQSLPSPDLETGKWNPKGHTWENDTLFDIVRVEKYEETATGEKETIGLSWSVRAGQWAQYFMKGDFRQVCNVSKKLVELSHRDDRRAEQLAKKIGQYVSLQAWRLGKGQELVFAIKTLCTAIGEIPEKEEKPGRFRKSFETALSLLVKNGIFESINYGPAPSDKQTKGWLQDWLQQKIVFNVPQNTDAPKKPKRQIHEKRRPPFDGSKVREKRQQLKMTQQQLAHILRISVKSLINIENNKVYPSYKVRKRIQEWLQQ